MLEPRWVLLIHQLPPKPLYLRAKIRQRLERGGAIPLKNSEIQATLGGDFTHELEGTEAEAANLTPP